ncbi:hypothetical protein MKX03_024117 [Papaver bracteatum]|nr:hypothetical protein MKX03_024117 [Papaver bracteatum]
MATEISLKRCVSDLTVDDLRGKKVLLRVDLDVLDENCYSQIRATAPTIQYLIKHGARVILCGLGQRDGVTSSKCSVDLMLSEVIGTSVVMAGDCIGKEVDNLVAALQDGGVLLLENLRMYKQETENDIVFAQKLASLADLYVNDAFRTTIFAHASTVGVTKFLKPAVAGLVMTKELNCLNEAASHPKRPFAAFVFGSKLSSKSSLIEALLDKVDILLLGGEMIFTFYRAQGRSVGSSIVEEHMFGFARSVLKKALDNKVELVLPKDAFIIEINTPGTEVKHVSLAAIPKGWRGVDIGPLTIFLYNSSLAVAKTIIWMGAMGASDRGSNGTDEVAKSLAELSGKGVTTIVAGGVLIESLERLGVADKISHISRGGDAILALLQGKPLPGVLALEDAVQV